VGRKETGNEGHFQGARYVLIISIVFCGDVHVACFQLLRRDDIPDLVYTIRSDSSNVNRCTPSKTRMLPNSELDHAQFPLGPFGYDSKDGSIDDGGDGDDENENEDNNYSDNHDGGDDAFEENMRNSLASSLNRYNSNDNNNNNSNNSSAEASDEQDDLADRLTMTNVA
jgi:hypothetical protein